jgi:class 3 adenylate cyclase
MEDAISSAVHTEQRRLAAIMFTDIMGFSRRMGSNEARMLRLLDVHNQLIQQAVAEHHGAVIKTVGDAVLVDSSFHPRSQASPGIERTKLGLP